MRLNLLDYALLAVAFGSMLAAAVKGFTYEVLMMAATLAGIALAGWQYPALAAHWRSALGARGANVAAFLAILIAVLLLATVVARIARGAVKAVGLGWMDRLLGALLGLARGILVGAAVLMMLVAYPFNTRLVSASRLAPAMLWISRGMALAMPAGLRARFADGFANLPDGRLP